MLKIIATVNNRRTLFLGFERINTERMHNDMPIVIDLQALAAGMDPVQDIVIFAEETLEAVHARLKDAGLDLPPFTQPAPDEARVYRAVDGPS